jgi:hypothetical protein
MTAEELEEWRAFCEWLNTRPRKCAYYHEVPTIWSHLVCAGAGSEGAKARAARAEAGLIFYGVGWGYRLTRGWRSRLAELEKSSR